MRLTALVAAIASVAMATPYARQESSDAFLIAVLNRDGLAVPFAAFNGRRWVSPMWKGTISPSKPARRSTRRAKIDAGMACAGAESAGCLGILGPRISAEGRGEKRPRP